MAQTSNPFAQEYQIVAVNVFCFVGIAMCVAMIVIGAAFSSAYPSYSMISVHLIVQGSITVLLPLLYLVYYRCCKMISERYFLSLYFTWAVGCIAWLIAGIVFQIKADRSWNELRTASVSFIIILFVFLCIVSSIMYKYIVHKLNQDGVSTQYDYVPLSQRT